MLSSTPYVHFFSCSFVAFMNCGQDSNTNRKPCAAAFCSSYFVYIQSYVKMSYTFFVNWAWPSSIGFEWVVFNQLNSNNARQVILHWEIEDKEVIGRLRSQLSAMVQAVIRPCHLLWWTSVVKIFPSSLIISQPSQSSAQVEGDAGHYSRMLPPSWAEGRGRGEWPRTWNISHSNVSFGMCTVDEQMG